MRNLCVVQRGVAAAAIGCAVSAFAMMSQSGPAHADEMWQTDWGTVVYSEDIGTMAILAYDGGAFYVDGLGGNYSSRGTYGGYWMDYFYEGEGCDVPAYDPYGNEMWAWGFINMSFIDPGYPARWQLSYTICDGPTEGVVNGYPM